MPLSASGTRYPELRDLNGFNPYSLCVTKRSMPPLSCNCTNLRPTLKALYHLFPLTQLANRPFSTTLSSAPNPSTPPPRWLSDLKSRLGRCIIFGLSNPQIDEASEILRIVARDWRELVAGSEGFLTGKGRAGCEGRDVVWGEMVSSTFI